MIQQLEKAISKLSELSEAEQEKITSLIMITIENKTINNNNNDPLAELKNSDFIGSFSDDLNLAEKSEQIAQDIMSKKVNHDYC
jgi:transcription initiation factor TFIIIB Brf1 subunit/transcription initiation factor TFIIB